MSARERQVDRINDDGTVYYILSPHGALLLQAVKITLIAFAAYILSANLFLFGLMVPIYALCLLLYHKLFVRCRRHGYKLFPFLLTLFLLNLPFLGASFFIRYGVQALISLL